MNQSVILLGVTCCMMFVTALLVYFTLNENMNSSSTHRNQVFWRKWLTLCLFISSSICNQWISSLTCRSVQMFYDQRYMSMLILQISGFIACLHFAYRLGNVIKPRLHHPKISTVSKISTSDSRPSLSSSINNIL
jgi:cytochrome bd-type quinol oxidase subunit 2